MSDRATATFKPRDVEELVDFYLHRRLANVAVRFLAPLRVTPDQVTISSGLVALLAMVLIGWAGSSVAQLYAGAAVFMLSITLDCADGQLARLRGVSSLTGRALDGFVDVVSVAAIFVGQFLWMNAFGFPMWLTMLVGWTAGFSVRWHAHAYDHVKNVYLHNTEGGGSHLPSFDEIERERQEHVRRGRWFGSLVLQAFAAFTRVQRKGLEGQIGMDEGGALGSPAQRAAYRNFFRGYMRLWTFNGLGTHLFLFVVSTLLIPVFPAAPLWAWGVVIGPMNLLGLGLELWRPRAERRFREELARIP